MIAKIIFIFMVTSLIASVEPTQRFIVLLKNSEESHYEWLKECLNMTTQHVTSIKSNTDRNLITVFSVKGQISGYSAWLSSKFVKDELMKRTEIKLVEEDKPVKINYVVPRASTVLPNLDRIDQANLPLDKKVYTAPKTAGAGTKVYVIDTGILTTHSEFENRATFGGAFCAGCPNVDDNGHGSHVSGIVAGKTHGVANKANVIGIKVLDANGSGTNADVIKGMMFVLSEHIKAKTDKSIVNMSLGGTLSVAVNTAAKSLTDAGIHLVVAAGNESDDACKSSPSSEKTAITVAASDPTNDIIAGFSNTGPCVDIVAPGVNIESVDFSSNSGFTNFDGTSQASPHVAGTVALIIAQNKTNPTPAEMADILTGLSSKNVIKGLKADTPNNFLRVPS